LRHSNIAAKRNISVYYVTGTASGTRTPAPPPLVRNADEWEICLAQITVAANATSVSQAAILDTRANADLCGFVVYLGQSVDTTAIFTQYEDYLNGKIAEWNAIQETEAADWETQMANQQSGYEAKANDFNNWFGGAQSDIAAAAQFNYDNPGLYPGTARSVVFNPDGSITESMTRADTGHLFATRETIFNPDGSISITLTVYQPDGETVQLKTEDTVTFNSDCSISEDVEIV
jgi:hypothetical protein